MQVHAAHEAGLPANYQRGSCICTGRRITRLPPQLLTADSHLALQWVAVLIVSGLPTDVIELAELIRQGLLRFDMTQAVAMINSYFIVDRRPARIPSDLSASGPGRRYEGDFFIQEAVVKH